MEWWQILALIIVIACLFGGNSEDDTFSYDSNERNPDSYHPQFDFPNVSSHSNVEPKKWNPLFTYVLKVRVEGNKYARMEEIEIEARNRQEARQKAINMGYRVYQCN
jgi:hypothetical protein